MSTHVTGIALLIIKHSFFLVVVFHKIKINKKKIYRNDNFKKITILNYLINLNIALHLKIMIKNSDGRFPIAGYISLIYSSFFVFSSPVLGFIIREKYK